MKKETRTIVYDEELKIEAYHFQGIVQPFPNHFHEYYVIGFVEEGQRILSCKNKEYTIGRGSIVLFQPGDNHACEQCDGGNLDYRGFNISQESMLDLTEEMTGRRELPGFLQNVICDEEICREANLSKSALLRAFTREKGITPYRYLENIRISEAKKLLGQGAPPLEAAVRTGFSDQSYFTNYFSSFIGLTPGAYREIFRQKDKEMDGGQYEG